MSTWWMPMPKISSLSYSFRNSCQWGMARISMVASTGSPSSPVSSRYFRARMDWSQRMLELTAMALPDSSPSRAISRARSRDISRGFWHRMPFRLGHFTAWRTISSCWSGG